MKAGAGIRSSRSRSASSAINLSRVALTPVTTSGVVTAAIIRAACWLARTVASSASCAEAACSAQKRCNLRSTKNSARGRLQQKRARPARACHADECMSRKPAIKLATVHTRCCNLKLCSAVHASVRRRASAFCAHVEAQGSCCGHSLKRSSFFQYCVRTLPPARSGTRDHNCMQ